MIQLYPKGTTAFDTNGITLHPISADMNWQKNGRYDVDMVLPKSALDTAPIDYGAVIRGPVPVKTVDAIDMGLITYWMVSGGQADVPLYKALPYATGISYAPWQAYRSYTAGNRVTYNKNNYRCTVAHGGLSTSPAENPDLWARIPNTTQVAGKVLASLPSGTVLMKTADYNSTYMEAVTLDGQAGYIEIAKCTQQGEAEQRTLPAFVITQQSFEITEIRKSQPEETVSIHAEHISYRLGRTMLGPCSLNAVTPQTALLFIAGAMQEDYPGQLVTNISTGAFTADFSWQNAQKALLDPSAGLAAAIGAQLIRDNLDIYLLDNAQTAPRYAVRYGANMRTVRWSGNVGSLVTRIYPVAQDADGGMLMLPELYVDTARVIPFVRPEVLQVDAKVGDTITDADGTERTLTEEDVYAMMRTAANNRFAIDLCDVPDVTLELDYVHMPDTEQYAQYAAMANAAPCEWVQVVNGPLQIDAVIQLTACTFDMVLRRYKKTTFGTQKAGGTVAGYQLQSGAVTSRTLASGSVTGAALAPDSVTARAIEAGSITADRLASRSIETELLAAGAVTADEIAAGSVSADKIAANAVTAEKISAGAVTAQKIDAGAVTAEKLAADAVTANKISASDIDAINAKLGTAEIASAAVETADINYLRVKDLSAGSAFFGQAIFSEGVGGEVFISRLRVAYAQMVAATIGDLVIKATDGNYYQIDVAASGNVTATQVQVTQEEIESGHTTGGRTIIDSDIVAENLSTTNIYATHALVNEITANTISVDALFAREATIDKINAMDLMSNTYIRLAVGDRTGHTSSLTNEVDGLQQRISELGYGTVYMQPTEPDHSELVQGDIWIQSQQFTTWGQVKDNYTWRQVKALGAWQSLGGIPKMFVWDGSKWQEMYDAALPAILETEIEQLSNQITLRATKEEVTVLGNQVSANQAQIQINADAIANEVSRAQTAEGGLIAKTSTYQTADSIVNAAKSYTDGELTDYSTTEQTATQISQYVASNAYGKVSGITITSSGIDIAGSQYVRIGSSGKLIVESGNFTIDASGNVAVQGQITAISGSIGGWTVAANRLSSGSGSSYVAMDSNAGSSYAIWAGAETAASAPFRVTRAGQVYLTKLYTINEQGGASSVDLTSYPLWKLYYKTIKSVDATTGVVTLSDGTTFNSARSVTVSGSWSGNGQFRATASNGQYVDTAISGLTLNSTAAVSGHIYATVGVEADEAQVCTRTLDVTSVYNDGASGVTVDRVQYNGSTQTIYNDSSGNLNVRVYVRNSNGTSGNYTINVPYRCID